MPSKTNLVIDLTPFVLEGTDEEHHLLVDLEDLSVGLGLGIKTTWFQTFSPKAGVVVCPLHGEVESAGVAVKVADRRAAVNSPPLELSALQWTVSTPPEQQGDILFE